MARTPKPWYWKQRKVWCVYLDGKKHILSPDAAEAKRLFHELMAKPTPPPPPPSDSVAVVLDNFLAWCYENRAKRTADRYKDFIQAFVSEYGRMTVSELHSGHVTAWLAGLDTWNSTTKHNAITALQRGFNWAVRNAGLKFNPIKGMEKPKPQTRTTVVTPEEFEELVGHVSDQLFRDLLIVSYDSGARPQEVKELEARHVELDKQRAVLPTEEGKKGIRRAFYFATERSMEIVSRLVKERPTGHLFLNKRGNPWTGYAVKCRFAKLEEKIGRRLHQYALRHSRITDWLLSGVDSHVVAKLAGHQNTAMLDKVYSHVADDYEYMLKNAKQTTNGDASGEE